MFGWFSPYKLKVRFSYRQNLSCLGSQTYSVSGKTLEELALMLACKMPLALDTVLSYIHAVHDGHIGDTFNTEHMTVSILKRSGL